MSLFIGRSRRPRASGPLPSSAAQASEISGERARLLLPGAASLQSQLGNMLAIGLAICLGVLALIWYYHDAVLRRGGGVHETQRTVAAPAPVGAALQRLGAVRTALRAVSHPAAVVRAGPARNRMPSGRIHPPPRAVPLAREMKLAAVPASVSSPVRGAVSDVALARRLMGTAFVASGTGAAGFGRGGAGQKSSGLGASGPSDALGMLLQPTAIAAVRARLLPTQHLLLAKGTFIDCTLQTAIDSTLPGMTTCTAATDTFSADGQVVLLERGTKLIGETRGAVQQGSARVFVLWTEARTPQGVVVPLDSPGTDALGRTGLPGRVERHFWQRFGAAILVSMIDGAVQAAVQASSSGGGTMIYNPSASTDVMAEVLKSSVNIPPTVLVPAGARIEVLVARDVDFRSVYELRSVRAQR